MSVKGQVILVSLWFATFMALLAFTIWGRLAEWNYQAQMSPWFRWLYPGWLHEKGANLRFQKAIAWFGLFFVPLVYLGTLVSILSHR